MDQLPTLKDVVSFIKDNWKIIALTTIAGVILYGIGVAYTNYSNEKATSEEAVQGESNNSGNLVLNQKERDDLQKKRVSFDFYVENEDGTPFVNYNLLKELLTTDDVSKLIEDKTEIAIEPTPKQAINVTLDSTSNILEVSVGTGSFKSNKLISNALYDAMKNGDIQFFNNKHIYISTPPYKNENSIAENEGTITVDSMGISSKKLVIYGALAIIISMIVGVIIAVIHSMTRKEISDTFTYGYKEDDILLNFTNKKNSSIEEKNRLMIHAVLHPKKVTKLILSELALNEQIKNELENQLNVSSQELDVQPTNIVIAQDLSEVNPLIQIDEVNILLNNKETTKNWYKNQRNQLKNYNAPVKVIQI